ncbi:MAG: osmoprotectant transport system permease protein [Glaciecola sp.]|uniref:glycine betaine ABC transporter substrate-binding protein n=1 Tax=Congregibacter sp. TaxID=2744308 RepID=UPI0039E280C6
MGSTTFSESHVLAEIAAQYLEAHDQIVERKIGLGGTLISYEALVQGELDTYPEYTGTLTGAVFDDPAMNAEGLEPALATDGLEFYLRLGFDNSYAIAMPEDLAKARGIVQISDLTEHPDLDVGLSHEFLNRGDGWPELQRRYGLPQQPKGIEHALAYRALDARQLDVADAYTTDGDLDLYRLRLLGDDLKLFPAYDAGYLIRQDLPPAVRNLLSELEGLIDEPTMRALNRRVTTDGQSPALVAFAFLRDKGLVRNRQRPSGSESRIAYNTAVYLKLTAVAVGLGCLVAIPLVLLLSRLPRIAGTLQYLASLFQTIPALALLALLIPVLGLGQTTAIFAGIKTAAIISIGTATLAAFVGAGRLGEPIITGLTLNNHRLILEGVIPAACLAIATELAFGLLERRFVPAHLRVG